MNGLSLPQVGVLQGHTESFPHPEPMALVRRGSEYVLNEQVKSEFIVGSLISSCSYLWERLPLKVKVPASCGEKL